MKADALHFNENFFFKRRFEGEWMIADLKSGDYFTLEGAASVIFDSALEGKATDEIAAEVSRQFPREPAKAVQNDVHEFLNELVRKNILINAVA